MWGRNLFMNVQRFLQFQMTCCFAVLVVVIFSYFVHQESALNAVNLIYINLVTDIFGALALASTKPTPEIAFYQAGKGNLMTPFMYRQIIGCMLGMVGVMMVIMCGEKSIFNLEYDNYEPTVKSPQKMASYTLIWNTFIFLQLFNLINCRDVSATKMHGFANLHRNKFTVFIILVIVAVQSTACFTFLGRPIFEADIHTG